MSAPSTSGPSITVRRPSELGHLVRDGVALDCHFAFRDYVDPAHTHWGRLRALNRIALAPHAVFALGQESAVEILTLVLEGAVTARVEARDDSALQAGDAQIVSAGEGMARATWTAGDAGAFLLQLWCLPEEEGGETQIGLRRAGHHVAPRQDSGEARRQATGQANEQTMLASGFPEDDPEETDEGHSGDPLPLKTRARVLNLALATGTKTTVSTYPERNVYALVLDGEVDILGAIAETGCGVALTGCDTVVVRALRPATLIVCDSD